MPKITVIMPVYNAGKYLAEAIESILNQSFGDFELLIFNDASTDESLDIAQKYAHDGRLQIISSEFNYGYVKHLNDGIRMARGEYIARMDADDISLKQRFSKQVHFLDTHPEVAVCGTWFQTIGAEEYVVKRPETHIDIFTHLFLVDSALGHPTVMMRKKALLDHHLEYDPTLMPSEDYALWAKVSTLFPLYNLQEVLLYYRMHESNISLVKNNIRIENGLKVKKYLLEYVLNTSRNQVEVLPVIFEFYVKGFMNKVYTEIELRAIDDFIGKCLLNKLLDSKKILDKFGKDFFLACYKSTRLGMKVINIYNLKYYAPSPLMYSKFLFKAVLKK